jgi:hypothetical protein
LYIESSFGTKTYVGWGYIIPKKYLTKDSMLINPERLKINNTASFASAARTVAKASSAAANTVTSAADTVANTITTAAMDAYNTVKYSLVEDDTESTYVADPTLCSAYNQKVKLQDPKGPHYRQEICTDPKMIKKDSSSTLLPEYFAPRIFRCSTSTSSSSSQCRQFRLYTLKHISQSSELTELVQKFSSGKSILSSLLIPILSALLACLQKPELRWADNTSERLQWETGSKYTFPILYLEDGDKCVFDETLLSSLTSTNTKTTVQIMGDVLDALQDFCESKNLFKYLFRTAFWIRMKRKTVLPTDVDNCIKKLNELKANAEYSTEWKYVVTTPGSKGKMVTFSGTNGSTATATATLPLSWCFKRYDIWTDLQINGSTNKFNKDNTDKSMDMSIPSHVTGLGRFFAWLHRRI